MKIKNPKKIKSIISRFKDARILVIGDVMLDEFIWGKVSRISPEAPVPVVWVNSETYMPGGASNVANNIATLGARTIISGVIGDDSRGEVLNRLLSEKGVDTDGLIVDHKRPTTVKTRVIAHHQQVVRIDKEDTTETPKSVLNKICDFVDFRIRDVDAVIIEDYGKGVISNGLIKEVVSIAKRKKKIIVVDPKEDNFSCYRDVTSITPNRFEAQNAVGFKLKNRDDLCRAGYAILKDLRSKSVLITLGEEGMALFEKGGKKPLHIPTLAQDVFDVSGAGDTVISVFTLSKCCGATDVEAANIANCAAGIVVGKVGIAVVTQEELIKYIVKRR